MRFLLPAVFLMAMPVTAFAEELSIGIPIRVVIVQCGTQAQAYEACESGTESRCCPVVDPAFIEDEKQISQLDVEKQGQRKPISVAQSGTIF